MHLTFINMTTTWLFHFANDHVQEICSVHGHLRKFLLMSHSTNELNRERFTDDRRQMFGQFRKSPGHVYSINICSFIRLPGFLRTWEDTLANVTVTNGRTDFSIRQTLTSYLSSLYFCFSRARINLQFKCDQAFLERFEIQLRSRGWMEIKVTVWQRLVYAHLMTSAGTDCFTF